MKKLFLVIFMSVFVFGESTFSNPQPSFDNPRKIIVQLYDADLDKVKENLLSHGFYLQLPPPEDNLLDEHKKQVGHQD